MSRQRVLSITAVALLAAYYLPLVVSTEIPPGLMVAIAVAIAAFGAAGAMFVIVSSRKKRFALASILLLLLLGVVLGLVPNHRRVIAARELRALGATVTADTDPGDGNWFRYGFIYLPCWLKDELGNEFFGHVEEIEFERTKVPVDLIADINFDETVGTLSLRFADLSPGDLNRMSQVVDARQVRLLWTPVDYAGFESLANIESLEHIEVNYSKISNEDCQRFITKHPGIRIRHMDQLHGDGYVRLPTTEPE